MKLFKKLLFLVISIFCLTSCQTKQVKTSSSSFPISTQNEMYLEKEEPSLIPNLIMSYSIQKQHSIINETSFNFSFELSFHYYFNNPLYPIINFDKNHSIKIDITHGSQHFNFMQNHLFDTQIESTNNLFVLDAVFNIPVHLSLDLTQNNTQVLIINATQIDTNLNENKICSMRIFYSIENQILTFYDEKE